jgi:hypothetical protein
MKPVSFVKFYFLFYIAIVSCLHLFAQRNARSERNEWQYEIEAYGTGVQGTYQVKVWTYTEKPENAIELAAKNAVHGIIFRGFPDKDRISGQHPLAQRPNLEQEQGSFFREFFQEGGKYLQFVNLVNQGSIGPGDRIKIGRQYKIGVVVSVNVAGLRKNLEDAGIIKSLTNGF